MDAKFVDIMTVLGIDVKSRHGKSRALSVADDLEQSRKFLSLFVPDIAQPESEEETKSVAETILRENLDQPEVKGDPTMAKAKKTVKKATKPKKEFKAKKPKVVKEKKAKVTKAPRTRGATPAEGTVALKLWKLLDRKDGATKAELLAASGWKACNSYIKKMATDYGKSIERTKKEGGVSRWKLN